MAAGVSCCSCCAPTYERLPRRHVPGLAGLVNAGEGVGLALTVVGQELTPEGPDT